MSQFLTAYYRYSTLQGKTFIALLKEKAFQLPALQFCVTLLSYVTKNKIRIADLQIFKMLEKVL